MNLEGKNLVIQAAHSIAEEAEEKNKIQGEEVQKLKLDLKEAEDLIVSLKKVVREKQTALDNIKKVASPRTPTS